jgi:predicted peroxiredoxin
MKNRIPATASLLLFTVAVLIAIATSAPAGEAGGDDGVFIHLSAGPENPHRILMAFKMAEVMAEGGKKVLVYCDIGAVKLLVKDAPDVSHRPFASSRASLEKLLEMGVAVRACPSCLKAADRTPDDLLPGVKTADRDEFFSFAGGRILSFGY